MKPLESETLLEKGSFWGRPLRCGDSDLLPVLFLFPDCGRDVTNSVRLPQPCVLHHDGPCSLKLQDKITPSSLTLLPVRYLVSAMGKVTGIACYRWELDDLFSNDKEERKGQITDGEGKDRRNDRTASVKAYEKLRKTEERTHRK